MRGFPSLICVGWMILFLSSRWVVAKALSVVLAGGTGAIGKGVAARCKPSHEVIILTRNAFLAATPVRVTEQFGWVGESYLRSNPHVRLRDWDGGDLLDIVGEDWIGWQEDVLLKADVLLHLIGGFTKQRVMATERLVQESLKYNPKAFHITVAPSLQDLEIISPGMIKLKHDRIIECETLVKNHCMNHACMRIEANRVEQECDSILATISGIRSE